MTEPIRGGRGKVGKLLTTVAIVLKAGQKGTLTPLTTWSYHSKLVVLQDPQTTAADDYLRIGKSKEKRYVFDHAFGELDDTEG